MYFGSQDKGIITYDGHTWDVITIPGDPRVYSLEVDESGRVYVGAASEFGYLKADNAGSMHYQSLMDKLDTEVAGELGVVFSILVHKNKIIYSTMKQFLIYHTELDSLEYIDHSEEYSTVVLLWEIDGRIIVADNTRGLLEFKDNTLVPLKGGDYFAYTMVRSLIPSGRDGELLVGTYDKGIILYNYLTGGINTGIIDPDINDELKEYKIYEGTSISNNKFALSTTAFGIYIFNTDGELVERINTDNSDLNDNSIYALYFDDNHIFPVLWVANFEYISKVYLLPYKLYVNIEDYDNSALNDFCVFQNDLYLSNDRGVLRSYTDGEDIGFRRLEGITNQTLKLLNFKIDNTELLLIGTINGIYSFDGQSLRRIDAGETVFYVRDLYQSKSNPELLCVGMDKGGIQFIKYENGNWILLNDLYYIDRDKEIPVIGNVSEIVEDKEGTMWFMTDNPSALYSFEISSADTTGSKFDLSGNDASDIYMINTIGDKLLISTEEGLLTYDFDDDTFVRDTGYISDEFYEYAGVSDIFEDPDGDLWFTLSEPRNTIFYYPMDEGLSGIVYEPFHLLPNTTTITLGYFREHVWIVKSKQLYIITKSNLSNVSGSFNTLVRKVVAGNDSAIYNGSHPGLKDYDPYSDSSGGAQRIVEIEYNNNDVSFFFSSSFYIEEDRTEYSYKLEGFDENWSRWDYVNYRDYTNLPRGSYNFLVKARNIFGMEGRIAEYRFEILRPWYNSILAYLAYIIIAFLLILLIIKLYTRRLKNENLRLEGIVAERTREVVWQKEELEASIHYASRIQRAILPSEDYPEAKVDDYFILFKPRDIVSGDFYWFSEKGSRLFIVAADCTGHGVPGAFMSILGISFLDEIINKSGYTATDSILNTLRTHVTEALKQMGENHEETKDGMDMGLLVYNKEDDNIEFSGAYNPCWKIRPMEKDEKNKYSNDGVWATKGTMILGDYILETIEADRMPIGISGHMDRSFSRHTQKMDKGATYYLFSDGYSDQFGGKYERKFLKKNLKKLILELQGLPLSQQKEQLERRLLEWKGDRAQVDDILVMGIKFQG